MARIARPFALVLGSLLATSAFACAAPAAEEDAAGGGQAIAEDEVIEEAFDLGPNGEKSMPARSPEAIGATTWQAFVVAKKDLSFVVLAAFDRRGDQVFEVALFDGRDGTVVQVRDPSGSDVAVEKGEGGKPVVRVGERTVAFAAVQDELQNFYDRITALEAGSGSSSGTTTQGLRIQRFGDPEVKGCGVSILRAVAGGIATLVGASATTVVCAGTVSIPVAGPIACGTLATATAAGAYATWKNGRAAKALCAE